jgi:hypothetical protein
VEKADLCIVMHLCPGGGNCVVLPAVVGPPALPAGPALPYRIDVLTAAGVQDATKTAALYSFMRDAAWNIGAVAGRGPSLKPGTMPIFVTDLPNPASGCGNGLPTCNNTGQNNYTPALPAAAVPNRTGNTGWAPTASLVYEEAMGNGNPTIPAGGFTFDLDFRRGGFYNWREQKWMLLLNINVRDLIKWNKDNGEPFFATNDSSEGGIVIFATIDGPLSNTINNYGIRVFGSADIPILSLLGQADGIGVAADPTGVTVATDQAMYVVGNFNAGPPGPARQPASLIGDSINVLSNKFWDTSLTVTTTCRDGQKWVGVGLPASRNAAQTTINAAFLGGVDTTPVNGGAANIMAARELSTFARELGWRAARVPGILRLAGTPSHVNGLCCGRDRMQHL